MSGGLPTKEGLMKWVDEIADQLDLPSCEALVLTKFAAYADASMESWAAVKTLARQGRCKERKLQYVLRDFEARGLIRRTGRMHRLPETTRDVPIYAFVGYLETLSDRPVSMGAQHAPIEADGCTEAGVMGAQGMHPHNEPIKPTPSDEGDAGAREVAFGRLEAAFPKRGLGFTHRNRARGEFWRFWDEGSDVEGLILAASAYAADRSVKRTDLGLDHWLADGKYRGWWPDAALPLGEPSAKGRSAAPVDPAWATLLSRLRRELAEEMFSYVERAALQVAADGAAYFVAATGIARDRVRDRCWRKVQTAWAEADPARRPLTLVSKLEFEQLAGAAAGSV